jgi:hypothetical protein
VTKGPGSPGPFGCFRVSGEEADDRLEARDDRVAHGREQEDENRSDHADHDDVLGHRLPFVAAPQLFEAQSDTSC